MVIYMCMHVFQNMASTQMREVSWTLTRICHCWPVDTNMSRYLARDNHRS